jgi:hypothetical protein
MVIRYFFSWPQGESHNGLKMFFPFSINLIIFQKLLFYYMLSLEEHLVSLDFFPPLEKKFNIS